MMIYQPEHTRLFLWRRLSVCTGVFILRDLTGGLIELLGWTVIVFPEGVPIIYCNAEELQLLTKVAILYNSFILYYGYPCGLLATCPGCTQPLVQCQLGSAPSAPLLSVCYQL